MDSGLKTRLLGAAVLIALAVIFVPMLLPGSNSGSQPASTKAVPEPDGEMQTRVLQVGPEGASAGSSTVAAINDPDRVATLNLEGHPAALQPLSSGLPIEATTAPAASVPASTPSTAPGVTPPEPAAAVAATQPGAWAVQLAAYSDEASANKMRDRLRGQGIDGYVDSVSTAKGKLWRVRAGPFASRNVAESTRAEIAQKFNVKGNIVTAQ
jgi:cell division septation protein DedD